MGLMSVTMSELSTDPDNAHYEVVCGPGLTLVYKI